MHRHPPHFAAELRPKIVNGLRAKHASPPIEAAEAVLRRAVGPERLRQLLYYPDEEDMQVREASLRLHAEHVPRAVDMRTAGQQTRGESAVRTGCGQTPHMLCTYQTNLDTLGYQ